MPVVVTSMNVDDVKIVDDICSINVEVGVTVMDDKENAVVEGREGVEDELGSGGHSRSLSTTRIATYSSLLITPPVGKEKSSISPPLASVKNGYNLARSDPFPEDWITDTDRLLAGINSLVVWNTDRYSPTELS